MEINGLGRIDGPQSIRAPHRADAIEPKQPTDAVQNTDRIDISPEAEAASFVQQVHDLPDIRAERVDEIRAQIEAGSYDTEERLDVAVGRLLDEIG